MPSAMSSAIDPVGMTSTGDPDLVAEPHDRALAELPLDLCERGVERLVAVCRSHGCHPWSGRVLVSHTRQRMTLVRQSRRTGGICGCRAVCGDYPNTCSTRRPTRRRDQVAFARHGPGAVRRYQHRRHEQPRERVQRAVPGSSHHHAGQRAAGRPAHAHHEVRRALHPRPHRLVHRLREQGRPATRAHDQPSPRRNRPKPSTPWACPSAVPATSTATTRIGLAEQRPPRCGRTGRRASRLSATTHTCRRRAR